jgi:hypothetical protein
VEEKNMRVVMMLLVAGLLAAPAGAAVYYQDNFENAPETNPYTVAQQVAAPILANDSDPTGAQVGNTIFFGWGEQDQIQVQVTNNTNDPVGGPKEGLNCLRAHSDVPNMRNEVEYGFKLTEAVSTGRLVAEWWMRIDGANPDWNMFIRAAQTTSSEMSSTMAYDSWLRAAGSIWYWDGAILLPTAGVWQKYVLDMDLDAKLATLSVDGVAGGVQSMGSYPVQYIGFLTRGGVSTFIDDAKVVPEPATMLLLSLGGLAALRRRH